MLFAFEPIAVLFALYLTVVYIVLFTFLTGYEFIFTAVFGLKPRSGLPLLSWYWHRIFCRSYSNPMIQSSVSCCLESGVVLVTSDLAKLDGRLSRA